MKPLGLLAGNGRFPFLVAEEAKKKGRKVVIIGFKEEADPSLEHLGDRFHWVHVGQFKEWIKIFRKENVEEVVMAGLVRHSSMYEDFKRFHPDMTALKIFWKAKDRKADTLLGAVAEELQEHGLTLIPSITHLTHCLAPKGVWTKKKPSSKQKEDMVFGFNLAKEMAGLDVGQTVCVKNKAIVAIEAMEGTDRCIQRAGEISKGDFVIVKVSKPKQDLRFDVPVIGLNTIKNFQEAGGGVLAVEANKTLVLDKERLVEWADSENIILVGFEL